MASMGIYLAIAIIESSSDPWELPLWACAVNTIPIFLIMSLFRLPGAGNWAGAIMCGGLSALFALFNI